MVSMGVCFVLLGVLAALYPNRSIVEAGNASHSSTAWPSEWVYVERLLDTPCNPLNSTSGSELREARPIPIERLRSHIRSIAKSTFVEVRNITDKLEDRLHRLWHGHKHNAWHEVDKFRNINITQATHNNNMHTTRVKLMINLYRYAKGVYQLIVNERHWHRTGVHSETHGEKRIDGELKQLLKNRMTEMSCNFKRVLDRDEQTTNGTRKALEEIKDEIKTTDYSIPRNKIEGAKIELVILHTLANDFLKFCAHFSTSR